MDIFCSNFFFILCIINYHCNIVHSGVTTEKWALRLQFTLGNIIQVPRIIMRPPPSDVGSVGPQLRH